MNTLDSFALILFATINVVTFCAFGYDKWRAGRSGQRIAEINLVLLGAVGGWLGGLIGMNVFRHKTAKGTFKFRYALALFPFVALIWVWLHFR